MAERTEIKITRSDVIVVDSIELNSYGDLTWKDKAGKDYKVSAKRVSYFDKIILPNMAVKLTYAEAYGKEYIHKAELVSDLLPTPPSQAPQSTETPSKKEMPSELPKPKPMPSKDIKNLSYSLSYAKDLAVAKIIVVDKILAYAETFRMYLDGEISLENPVDFTIEIMKHFKRLDDKEKSN